MMRENAAITKVRVRDYCSFLREELTQEFCWGADNGDIGG
jgi:hypothetical protein